MPTGRTLEHKALPLDTQHANGYLNLDTHNYYGTQETKATHEWFTKQGLRTFIIERESFAGLGKYGSRWLGDNMSEEDQMANSVAGVMLNNIFGITLAGSDICGFAWNTNHRLCTKWHIVGAFQPFSRNHYPYFAIAQEPWQFANFSIDGHNCLDVMRDAIKMKYALNRYYYSHLFAISTQDGYTTLYKPLFFEFPNAMAAHHDVIFNVMLGDALKLSINPKDLDMPAKDYYFPRGWWCSLAGSEKVGTCFNSVGQYMTYPAKEYDYQLHLREGYIIPMQDTFNESIKFQTTSDLQKYPIDLHVLGKQVDSSTWTASGIYFTDDGVTLEYQKRYNKYSITAMSTST